MIRWWTNLIYITKKNTWDVSRRFCSFFFVYLWIWDNEKMKTDSVERSSRNTFSSFRSYMCTPAPNEIFRGWLEKMMTFKGFEISSYTTCKLFLLILVEWIFGRRFSSFKRINFFLAKKLCSFATCNLKKKYNDFLRKHVH